MYFLNRCTYVKSHPLKNVCKLNQVDFQQNIFSIYLPEVEEAQFVLIAATEKSFKLLDFTPTKSSITNCGGVEITNAGSGQSQNICIYKLF